MQSADLAMELEIDGRKVSSAAAHVLLQQDPYPGGHEYVLRVRGREAVRAFRLLQAREGGGTPAPDSVADTVAWLLMRLRQPTDRVAYFLNTVSGVCVSSTEVCVRGVCSPVVEKPS